MQVPPHFGYHSCTQRLERKEHTHTTQHNDDVASRLSRVYFLLFFEAGMNLYDPLEQNKLGDVVRENATSKTKLFLKLSVRHAIKLDELYSVTL